ncbi:hypothetical protein [Vibrio splendidus]|uniref:hypothetical protein n=1 Tax=Vibrio splendidus TaxID=29497 RepID=UPI0021B3FB4D|nr:hypothetical protein [Vibrio splendidus]UXA00507.1 hypothetical protein IM698_18000 [Vibrio splendidus]
MLEQQFDDECKKLGVINVNKLDNDWASYQAVYLEMTQNGDKDIKVTEYHNRTGGQYHIAKAAFNLLKRQSSPHLEVEHPRPIWFQQVVATITSNAEGVWQQIDEQMSIEIARKTECTEAAMRKTEYEYIELEKHLDSVSCEKSQLEKTVNSLMAYRDKNEKLQRSAESKSEKINFLEERLNDAKAIAEKYEVLQEQLNQLQVEHAEISTQLVLRNEQVSELKTEVQWLRKTHNKTSNTSLPTGTAQSENPGSLIESIQNGDMG